MADTKTTSAPDKSTPKPPTPAPDNGTQTPHVEVQGSPVTAGTKDNTDAGEGGVKATEGNKSPSTVAAPSAPAGGSTTVGTDGMADDKTGESPTPSEADLDKIDEIEAARDDERNGLEDGSHAKVVRLVAALPTTTPDSATFGGYGGVVITYGDLRNIAARHRRSIDT